MKDIKYIIKRVIIGVLIAVILMMLKNKSISAEEIGNIYNVNMHSTFTNEITFNPVGQTNNQNVSWETLIPQIPPLKNSGKGFVIFSFAYYSSGNYAAIVEGVSLKSGSELFACDIGNLEPYTDSKVQYKQATAKCYVNFASSGWERLRFTIPYLPGQSTSGGITIQLGRYATFVGSPTPQSNQNVVNAITQQSQQQIQLQTQTNAKLDQQIANQQTMIQQQQQQNQNIQNINDSINDDNVDAQDSQITDMQNAISSNDSSGLSGIITAPLRMVNNLTLPCQPINLTIPYMNKDLTLQCMSTSVYPKFSGLAIVGIIVNGFLIYRVIASLYYMVKGFKDPENDKVEVMDL